VADDRGRSVAKPGNIQPQPQASQTLVDLPGYPLITGVIGQSLISSVQVLFHSGFISLTQVFHSFKFSIYSSFPFIQVFHSFIHSFIHSSNGTV
jgi:hypothetical protein